MHTLAEQAVRLLGGGRSPGLIDMGRDTLRLFQLVNPPAPAPAAEPSTTARATPSPVRRRGFATESLPSPSRPGRGQPPDPPKPAGPPSVTPPSHVLPSTWQADVALRSGGCAIAAHRWMLVARSSFFAAMLSAEWSESQAREVRGVHQRGRAQGAIELTCIACLHPAAACLQVDLGAGLDSDDFKRTIEFLYSGLWLFPADAALSMAEVAARFDLPDLADACEETMRTHLCHRWRGCCGTCLSWYIPVALAAEAHLRSALLSDALDAIAKHPAKVWAAPDFAGLSPELVAEVGQRAAAHARDRAHVLRMVEQLQLADAKLTAYAANKQPGGRADILEMVARVRAEA